MKIDVAVLTKDSAQYILQCLDSIIRNVPLSRLIIVDGYSTDNTLELVKRFETLTNIIVIKDHGNRAVARQKAIDSVETEWFMFVDSDVVLCDYWFKKVQKYMEPDVGLIWGYVTQKNPQGAARMDAERTLFNRLRKNRNRHEVEFTARGGTHDTLIRLKAVENIRIPSQLHFYEDMFIKNWVEAQGYKVISTPDPCCIHFGPLTASKEELILSGVLEHQLGTMKFLRFIRRLLLLPIRLIWVAMYTKNLSAIQNTIRNNIYPCVGWLKALYAHDQYGSE